MSNKIIITKFRNHLISAIYNGKELVQANVVESEEKSILGNIYIGKVDNIVKNINAAFVEISKGLKCYFSLEENKNPIFTKSNNSNKVKIGDELIVQVSKEAIKTKAPVVTSNFNLLGKYIILVHGRSSIGISTKIASDEIKSKLKELLEAYRNEEYGFIVRTNAQDASQELIIKDIEELIEKYNNIKKYGVHKTRFTLLHQEVSNYIKDIRDNLSGSIEEIITDESSVYDDLKDYLENQQPEDLKKLRFYDDPMISLSNLFSLHTKLEQAVKPHVWLKSGASLVIQPTEALTVIDVNTEKAIAGRKNTQETFLKINLEAAAEVARQIRLRNLTGIIIVDFIDMEDDMNKETLMKQLERLLRMDPVKTVLVDMTALGLVEITRKKVKKPLHEQLANYYN